jgi:type IV pilus assembly protein PilC
MPRFTCKVKDGQGRERLTTQEASSEDKLVAQLQKEGLLVISVIRQQDAEVQRRRIAARRIHLRISSDDLILFSRQLATLLEAGVTLLKSLDILARQIESKRLLEAIEEIRRDVAGGSTLHDALGKHKSIFSEFWVHVVETGEASGALPVVLAQLADYLESSAAVRRKVISALIYPVVLILLVVVALAVFTVWIIPIFSQIFESFNAQLPAITMVVITFSRLARKYFLFFFAIIGISIFLFYKYIHTEKGQWKFDRLMLKMPILSSLFQQIAIERFASGLGTLIDSGVPILYGLDIVAKAVGNKVVEEALIDVRDNVRQGKSMGLPLEESGVFTPMVVQMVSVGEEVGELGKMLKKISEFYKERIATTLSRVTVLIEPAVLIFMGVVIGFIVVSMFLPVFNLAMIARGQ